MNGLRASIIIATYQRHEGLRRLLGQLATQSVPADKFEAIVVDDGSIVPFELPDGKAPYALRLIRQSNAGPAAARHRGIEAARGEILVVIDDDMQIERDFLERHLAAHPEGTRRAALGPIIPDPGVDNLPLFEQWNAQRLDRVTRGAASGVRIRGNNMWTGNVSFRREDYLAVGGFDPALRVSEDLELGMRLEAAGVEITWARGASAVHRSDHSNETWLRRAAVCGRIDTEVARKHPGAVHADPWRYYYLLPRFLRPLLSLAFGWPALGAGVARGLLGMGRLLLALHFRALAIRVAATVYAAEYFRGMRIAEGSSDACRAARDTYLARSAELPELPPGVPRRRAYWLRFRAHLAADHALRRRHEEHYGYAGPAGMGPVASTIQKIGVQMMTAVRLMSFFRDAGHPLLAKMTSRLIRHLYGSDVHWDAQWAPGVTLVHGFGLAISHAARVGPGCIVFQNVCLGMGIDAGTRATGAPTLESDCHVGPGATLLGPIRIGAGTKVMAGAVLTESVPPRSLVEAPASQVRPRKDPQLPASDVPPDN